MKSLPTQHIKFAKGDRRRVHIEGLGSLGEGLARIEGAEIFVPKTTLGDEVEIEILEYKKGRYHARLIEVIKGGENRRSPLCPHFLDCGGCDFQHLSYDDQMAWKLRMTKHWIRRSPLEPLLKTLEFDEIRSPKEFGYRHRVRLQLKDHSIHFFKPHSNELLKLATCPVLTDGLFESLVSQAKNKGDQKDWNVSALDSYILDGHELRFDESCFTQANLEVNELIWERIKEDVSELSDHRSALDLYCGIGNFSIPLKDHFEKVVGVEAEGLSLEWARRNSDQVEWKVGAVEKVIEDLWSHYQLFSFVLLDPPRAGMGKSILTLAKMRPPRITYVSCSLESLIVDLTALTKRGDYRIARWTVADMFPQTHHIESVVSLVPK